MRPSTLFLATFVIWITAKGKAKKYWSLATVSDVAGVSSSTPAGASGSATVTPSGALPDILGMGQKLLSYYGSAVL